MTASLFLFALSVAFPRPDARLPAIDRCYVIGAVEGGATNVVVAGRNVPVHSSGAWATLVDVVPGSNTLVIAATENGVPGRWSRTFTVAAKPKADGKASAAKTAPPPKKYEKLPYAADTPKPHPRGKAPGEVTVVIDPGHGGATDFGALSPHGWREKDVNLLLAEDVRDALEKRGYRVVMTRRNDRALPLRARPKIAHEEGADAFVSIHHNAPPADRDAGKIRYACVYAWNPIGDALAGAIAKRMDDAQRADLPGGTVRRANFVVMRNPEIPSCLVEADFITHPEGEAAAWDPVRRAKVGAAIAAGIADWHAGR